MSSKTIAVIVAGVMGFSVLLVLWAQHDHSVRVGKYLSQHRCTHIEDRRFENQYECDGRTLTESDIINITENQ